VLVIAGRVESQDSGVEIYPHPFPTKENIYGWKTVIYKGAGINKLMLFITGPEGMKDINNRILRSVNMVL
jgi:hypothetical protein